MKLGPLEISASVEPQDEGDAAEANMTMEHPLLPLTGSTGWWWERQKRPLLAEAFVFLFAIGLLAYALVDPHDIFGSPKSISGFIAAVALVAVIGRRALRTFRP